MTVDAGTLNWTCFAFRRESPVPAGWHAHQHEERGSHTPSGHIFLLIPWHWMQWLGEMIHLRSKFTVSDGNVIDMTHTSEITTGAKEHGRRRRALKKQMPFQMSFDCTASCNAMVEMYTSMVIFEVLYSKKPYSTETKPSSTPGAGVDEHGKWWPPYGWANGVTTSVPVTRNHYKPVKHAILGGSIGPICN